MGKIYCICGKSSSGKDTVYKRLLADESLKLNQLVTYTTRPIREGEENGREYFFIDEAKAIKLHEEGKIVESRAYNTVFGIWKYMTVDDGDIELDKKSYRNRHTRILHSDQKLLRQRQSRSGND